MRQRDIAAATGVDQSSNCSTREITDRRVSRQPQIAVTGIHAQGREGWTALDAVRRESCRYTTMHAHLKNNV
jgi:hypothetical protein